MTELQSIYSADLVYAGVLRDGGSAVIIVQWEDQKIKFRVMRSIAERSGENFNRIEVSIADATTWIVKSGSDIDGLSAFTNTNKDRLDPRVLEAINSTFPS